MSAVALNGIVKTYDRTPVIADVSLTIARGEFVTLLGPSGCGKTTLLRIIAGLVEPNSGAVVMDGKDVTATPVHHREIGMVFQAHALFPHMTVGENVAFGLKMRGVPKSRRMEQVVPALATVRLQEFADRMPHELSGGQQQRVAIARAIVIKPKVLLLDEPFGALDRKLREALQVELRDVTRSLGITSVFVTHDQEEALVLSDRIAVMNAGRLEQVAPPREIFEQPSTRFVADFMGFANLRGGTVSGVSGDDVMIEAEGLRLVAGCRANTAVAGGRVEIGIRQERISIRRAVAVRPSDSPNEVAGVVESGIYHGNLCSYRVRTKAGEILVARAADGNDGEAAIETGAAVTLGWDKTAVRIFSS